MPAEDPLDPILAPSSDRFVLRPTAYPQLFELYKQHLASFWTLDECDLEADRKDWARLNDGERHFLESVLAFFAASDGVVSENLALRFYKEVQLPEARAFYAVQLMMEQVHSETYVALIDTYVDDQQRKNDLFRAIELNPTVQAKAAWAQRYIDSDVPFAERLLAFAVVEGIFFSASFAAIFYMKKRGLLPGLSFTNQLISRDEGLHATFAVTLHGLLRTPCTASKAADIVRDAVAIEKEFVTSSLPVELLGMNSAAMCTYVEFVADHLLTSLGFDKLWGSSTSRTAPKCRAAAHLRSSRLAACRCSASPCWRRAPCACAAHALFFRS